jgi:hypothetical protein
VDVLRAKLFNSRAAMNVPARKTDVSNAVRPAQLGAHGL